MFNPSDESAQGHIDDPEDRTVTMIAAPAVATAVDFNSDKTDTSLLLPNLADIRAHLFALFDPAFVHPYPDAWIEIAYGHPFSGNKVNQAQWWSAFEPNKAAEFAAAKNAAGFNVYVGVALRQGKEPRDGRADGENFLASAFSWIEYDQAGDDERVEAICAAKKITPAIRVVTGTIPNPRVHLYFLNTTPITKADDLIAANTALRAKFGSDAVQNVDRVLRLAGTVNYPQSDKAAKGYVTELTTMQISKSPTSYSAEVLRALSPPTAENPFTDFANEYGSKKGKSDEELTGLLKQSRAVPGKGWREPMLAFTASTVGKGWSDIQIKLATAPYADGGIDDPDIQKLIDTARKRFEKPDGVNAESEPMQRGRQQQGSSDDGEPPAAPGIGHNKKKTQFHILIAHHFVDAMKRGETQLLRQVPDLKGVEHIYRHRDGLWSLQSDRDAERSLHQELQRILIALGKENQSVNKFFNEASKHILRSANVCCQHEAVTWDAHGKVPTLDGLIDPLTHRIEPFKPEHFATWQIPVHFDAVAQCPSWQLLLNDAFADMTETDRTTTIELLQELIGMALIDNKPKSLSRATVLQGGGDTGKTTLLKVVAALFGGVITTPFSKLDGPHGLQQFINRLPWVLGEAFNQSGWHLSDLVKSIITGDPVEINPKNARAVSSKVNAPAFWGTNHPPKFKESSGSMATRMIIIQMTRSFDKCRPVGVAAAARLRHPAWEPSDLVMTTELPGVLNWALEGLRRALERGFFVNTRTGENLLEESRMDSNCVASFVEECITHDPTVMMRTADFYAAFWMHWIELHGERGEIPSPTRVGLDLASLPRARIAQNKKVYRLEDGSRFYVGCYLNNAGRAFWEVAANVETLSGRGSNRLAEQFSRTKEPVKAKWKETDEYRRVLANTGTEKTKAEPDVGDNFS